MKQRIPMLLSIMILCLLSCSLYTEAAYTTIESVTYPETVIIGKSFEVTVVFDYSYPTSSLYGDHIYLYYAIGLNPVVDFDSTQYVIKDISDLPNAPAPRPSEVVIKIDTDDFVCKINDTFRFRIKFTQGLNFYPEPNYYDMGTATSDNYDLMLIENPNKIDLSTIRESATSV